MPLGTPSQMMTRWLVDTKTTELDMVKEINRVTDLMTEAVLAGKEEKTTSEKLISQHSNQ